MTSEFLGSSAFACHLAVGRWACRCAPTHLAFYAGSKVISLVLSHPPGSPPYFQRQVLSLSLELVDSDRLAGQQAWEILLSPLTQHCWTCFLVRAGDHAHTWMTKALQASHLVSLGHFSSFPSYHPLSPLLLASAISPAFCPSI